MASFLKWADKVLDHVDETASDKLKDVRGVIQGLESVGSNVEEPADSRNIEHNHIVFVSTDSDDLMNKVAEPSEIATTNVHIDICSSLMTQEASDAVRAVASTPGSPRKISPTKNVHGREPSKNDSDPENSLKAKVRELQSEAASLRTVWQETRDALGRAKKLLVQKDDQYRKSLKEKDQLVLIDMDKLEAEYQEQIKELKRTITQNQVEFSSALSAKEGHREDQEKGFEELRQQRDDAISRAARLQEDVKLMELQREELLHAKQEVLQQHKKVLLSLREEQEAKDEILEKQHRIHATTLQEFQSRETSLEEHTVGYVQAVAAAQREVEEKSRELSRVQAEARWIKADQQALRDEVAALQHQLAQDKATRVSTEASWQQRLDQAQSRLEQEKRAVLALTATHAGDEVKIRQLTLDLQNERETTSKQQVSELESRLSHIAEHYTAQVDSLSSERSTLRLLLEDERTKSKLLEAQLKSAKEQYLDDDNDESSDITVLENKGMQLKRRNRGQDIAESLFRRSDIKSPTVKKAISFLDSFGSYMGFLLRRNPAARLLFAVYVLLIHLWVIMVLYHTFHSSVGDSVLTLEPPRMNASQLSALVALHDK